jgi:hypothetical protein
MYLEDILTSSRKELEREFNEGDIRSDDTLLDLRYFLIKDAYLSREFPPYQDELLSLLPSLSVFRKEEDLFNILYQERVEITFASLFSFSIEFMELFIKKNEFEDINFLRFLLGRKLFEKGMIAREDIKYFASPYYEINMLNSDSLSEAEKIFFAYDSIKDIGNKKDPLYKVVAKLNLKKYLSAEKEKDLNSYLFIKYEDKIFDKTLPLLDSDKINSILDTPGIYRKKILTFYMEDSKNPIQYMFNNLGLMRSFSSVNEVSFILNILEQYVPYRIDTLNSKEIKFFYKLSKVLNIIDLFDLSIYARDDVNVISLVDVGQMGRSKKLDIQRASKTIEYAKLLKTSYIWGYTIMDFIYDHLSTIEGLNDFLMCFNSAMSLSALKNHDMQNRDLFILTLLTSFPLTSSQFSMLKNEYPFEDNELEERIDTLNRDNIIYEPYTLRFAKVDLFAKYFNKNKYTKTIKYIADVFISSINETIFPNYKTEERDLKAMYRAGVNIHSGDRDRKTAEGVLLLINSQGSINNTEQLYQDFINYAVEILSEEEIKALNRILGINVLTGEKLEKRTSDFEGLFENKKLLIGNNVSISPKELIARFFLFSLTYKECETEDEECIRRVETERENLKYATVKGLISSLQDDTKEEQRINAEAYGIAVNKNHVVCNPGKIQRLVAATLSGRLKGLNDKIFDIEEVEKVEKVEEKKEKKEKKVQNLDEIHILLQPFIQYHMNSKETRVRTAEEFFEKLYEYVYNLKMGGIAKFGKVELDISQVVYYSVMMSMKGNILYIAPTLSLTSDFPDMFSLASYIEKYGEGEMKAWKEEHAEEIKRIEEAKETRGEMEQRAEEVRRRQARRRAFKEREGRSPERGEEF